MKVTQLAVNDVLMFEPQVYHDDRGFFFESYNQKYFDEILGKSAIFVQDNHSQSKKGVLRGLHYQLPPMGQGKLVRVIHGEIYDVAIDIRRSSATFGKWVGEILSAENKKQLWIPEGFAHGFITLSDAAEVIYKTTHYYEPKLERCIKWDEPTIGIRWPITYQPCLSDKDKAGSLLKEIELFL